MPGLVARELLLATYAARRYPIRGGPGSGASRDPHGRRAFQRGAVRVQRWPVYRLVVACAARPGGVAAAVPGARLIGHHARDGSSGT
jgi:hypothetical protein